MEALQRAHEAERRESILLSTPKTLHFLRFKGCAAILDMTFELLRLLLKHLTLHLELPHVDVQPARGDSPSSAKRGPRPAPPALRLPTRTSKPSQQSSHSPLPLGSASLSEDTDSCTSKWPPSLLTAPGRHPPAPPRPLLPPPPPPRRRPPPGPGGTHARPMEPPARAQHPT